MNVRDENWIFNTDLVTFKPHILSSVSFYLKEERLINLSEYMITYSIKCCCYLAYTVKYLDILARTGVPGMAGPPAHSYCLTWLQLLQPQPFDDSPFCA